MIIGMIIIVFVIIKEFFYKPEENFNKLILPKSIKIPDKSKLETINFNKDTVSMIVTLKDGTQQIILLDIENGIEKSRKYVEINNQK